MDGLNELLPVSPRPIGDGSVNAIDGRTLHAFLEVKKDFTTWMKSHIESFDFQEHRDFETMDIAPQNRGTICGARKEYIISLPMAKELAMVQRSPKGKQARRYFIECERRVMQPTLNPANMTRLQILTIAMEAEQKVQELVCKVDVMEPKVKALDRMATFSEGSFCIRDSAKILQFREKDLRLYMHEHGWIYQRPGKGDWIGHSEALAKGFVEHKFTEGDKTDGTGKWSSTQVRITAKGLVKLALIFGVHYPLKDEGPRK